MSSDQTQRFNIARYVRVGQLGKGTFSTVYKVIRNGQPQQVYALKVLRESMATPDELQHFREEAQLMQRLNSPSFPQFHEFGQELDYVFIAMEFVEGKSLEEILSTESTLPTIQVCRLIQQIGSALDQLQNQGVVHRDVKPSNLMRRPGGNFVLMDLGIACQSAPLAQPDQAGTPEYMAPERFYEGARLDFTADVYSLGCVIYQCLTGELPIAPGTNFLNALETVLPKPIRAYRSEFPEALDRVILKMLSKEPGNRFRNGAELSTAFASACREVALAKASRLDRPTLKNEASVWYEYAIACLPDNVLLQQEYDSWKQQVFRQDAPYADTVTGTKPKRGPSIGQRPRPFVDNGKAIKKAPVESTSPNRQTGQSGDWLSRRILPGILLLLSGLVLVFFLKEIFFKPAKQPKISNQSAATDSTVTTDTPVYATIAPAEARKLLNKGNDYLLGRNGKSKNPSRAMLYLKRAAYTSDNAIVIEASYAVGSYYATKRQDEKAQFWLKRAAGCESAEAELLLGKLIERQSDSRSYQSTACYWYQRAAQHNNQEAKQAIRRLHCST
ncbi:protein kinase domain-containing protein [Spirosoma aerolatum]|uniref:protein kinase domain-containing protein n=1 Tax=Spirosoma aerolatum TaxID=1211326 RepID=UPI0009AE1DEE|nr:protein kinase [Spirosoma aerolatum]